MTEKMISYFLIIALGFFLKSVGFLSEKDGSLFSKLIINVTLPLVIIEAITSVRLQVSLLFLTILGATAASLILVSGIFFFSKMDLPKRSYASLSLTLCGLNLAIFAYPFADAMWSSKGLTYMAMVDIGNALVIYTLGYSLALKYSNEGFSYSTMLKKLLTFPPLIAFSFALFLNFSSLSLPNFVHEIMKPIGNANAFLSMITIGVYLSFSKLSGELKHLMEALSVKYAVGFVVGVFLSYLCTLLVPSNSVASTVVFVSALMPTPLLSLIYSVEKDLDPEMAGGMVTLTVLASSFVLLAVGR